MRPDALDLRWYDLSSKLNEKTAPSLDPKPAKQRSITLKFHDGALTGTKLCLETKDKYTIGRSQYCDVVIPRLQDHREEGGGNIASIHASITYDRGYWYLEDHSGSTKYHGQFGTFLYPKNVLQMKNHLESGRIKVPWSPYTVNLP